MAATGDRCCTSAVRALRTTASGLMILSLALSAARAEPAVVPGCAYVVRPVASGMAPRYGAAAVVFGDRVLVFGGTHAGRFAVSQEYDLKAKRWRPLQLRRPLARRRFHRATVIDDRVYLTGGVGPHGPVRLVEALDLSTGTVRSKAPLPGARYLHGAIAHDGQVMVAGGRLAGRRTRKVLMFDPKRDIWRPGPPLSVPRDTRLASLGGEIYALGGYAGKGRSVERVVERFDSATTSWVAVAPMPKATSAYALVGADAALLTFGDYDALGRVQRYAPLTGWQQITIPYTPRRHATGLTLPDGSFWIIGGKGNGRDSATAVVQSFRLECGR